MHMPKHSPTAQQYHKMPGPMYADHFFGYDNISFGNTLFGFKASEMKHVIIFINIDMKNILLFFFGKQQTALCVKDRERRRDIIKEQLKSGLHYRYVHFPIHHKFHWTLLVHDKNEWTWKHYNSLRPRDGTDGHCKVATSIVSISLKNSDNAIPYNSIYSNFPKFLT